jgi:beta-glucosidase
LVFAEANDTTTANYPFQDTSLSDDARVRDLISRMTLDEKVGLLHQFSAAVTRLGVPQFRTGTEGLHGLSWLGYATVFPQASGIGMTWNPDLAEQIGDVIGEEARAYNSVDARFNGVDIWGPVVDIARDPRTGRVSESMGEDPLLIGKMATAMGEGMQGNQDGYLQSIPTLKHFAAYGQEASRTSYSANTGMRALEEYYFKVFKDPIQAGAVNSMMTGYNLLNGKPTMVSPEVSDEMYGDWVQGGTEGAFFGVTDAGSPANLSGSNAYYPNSRVGQAAAMADTIKNGVTGLTVSDTDTPTSRSWIYEALGRGMITETDIDKSIYGVLLVRLEAGDLDPDASNPYKTLNKLNALDTPEHRAVALQTAREQVVLLKNQGGILPLSKSADIALSGPLGDESSTDFYSGTFPYVTLIDDEMKSKVEAGNGSFSFTRGIDTVAVQVVNGTGTPADKFLTVGATAADPLTGTGTDASDPKAQFQIYDYGYNNLLMRSVATDKYVSATGPSNSLVANANPPGFQSPNRASQEWYTYQNFGIVAKSDSTFSMRFSKNTSPVATTAAAAVYVNSAAPYNVQHNGSGTSANRQFQLVTVKDGIADAVSKATGADVAVVAVGDEPHLTSRETYDRQTTGDGIMLPPQQQALINAVSAVNPNTVVVIVGSYSFDISDLKANPNVKGIVYTSHAGQELGDAVADVLFGDYAPSGRLTQTWYDGLEGLPTISDYDVIEGQRTYQYHQGDVLYPFGYGLSYSDFDYDNMSLAPSSVANSAIDNTTVNVKLSVKNTGTVASDEVVQVYASFDGKATSRVEHPIKTLVGFKKVNIGGSSGGMTQSADVTVPVRLSDLAIWDVATSKFVVEPGTYTISAGTSSADGDQLATAKLTVTGTGLAARNLGVVTRALNYDDYSFTDVTTTGTRADVIPISVMEDNSYGVSVRAAGAWIKYAQADLSGHPSEISMRASNSNATPATVEVWANGESAAAGGVKIGEITIPSTLHQQTFVNVAGDLTGVPSGTADIYLVSPSAGVAFSWFQLGTAKVAAQASDIGITVNTYNSNIATSLSRYHVKVPAVIQQKAGSLVMESSIKAPAVVTGAVAWSVTDTNGDATALANISAQGLLTATGTDDGTVRVTATFTTTGGTASASADVVLKNQTVAAGTNPEAVVIRSGYDSRPADISWGPNQFGNFGSIYQYQGSVKLSAVTYPAPTSARPVTFTVADKDGNPTNLATIAVQGAGFIEGQTSGANNTAYNATLTATGEGNGDVYVTATTQNGLTWTSKIVIQGQDVRDLSAGRYQAELFDGSGNVAPAVTANLRADNVSGDDVGMQLDRIRNGDWAVYRNVDFGDKPSFMTLRYQKASSEPATVTVMAGDPVTGTKIGEVELQGDMDITSASDYRNPVYSWKDITFPITAPEGVNDVYFVFDVSPAVPDTDISSTYGAVAGWLDLGLNWFTVSSVEASALADAINAANALNADDYTTSSWAAAGVDEAIAAAEAVLDSATATQAEVDAAVVALNEVLAQLQLHGNTQSLDVLIAAGDALSGKLGGFTTDSVAAFDTALASAKLESAAVADRTQAQLDVAVSDLQAAIDGLTVKAPEVNKVALQILYDTIKTLKNVDHTYTTPSWQALQTQLTNANSVLQSSTASQAAVDAASASLSEAVANLTVLDKRPIRLKLNQSQLRLAKGKSFTLTDGLYYRDVLPPSYSGKVAWKSSNTKIATVSSDGKVTAKKAGTVTITVTSKEKASTGKKLSVSIKVHVVSKPSKSKVTKVSATVPKTLAVGASAYVTGTYTPTTATGVSVTYSSSNTKVVTIDKAGRLLAKGPGKATVTVKAGGKSAKYTVTVP